MLAPSMLAGGHLEPEWEVKQGQLAQAEHRCMNHNPIA